MASRGWAWATWACGSLLVVAACGEVARAPSDSTAGAAGREPSGPVDGRAGSSASGSGPAPAAEASAGSGGTPPGAVAGGEAGAAANHAPEPCENAETNPTGGGFELCDDGSMRRHEPATCASRLPRGEPASGVVYDECLRDADCTERAHGACVIGACYYGCVQDSECADDQLCFCRDPVGTCESATCRSDADCPANYPCIGSERPPGGSVDFACQTPLDECQADRDCDSPDPRVHCVVDDGRRRCVRDYVG